MQAYPLIVNLNSHSSLVIYLTTRHQTHTHPCSPYSYVWNEYHNYYGTHSICIRANGDWCARELYNGRLYRRERHEQRRCRLDSHQCISHTHHAIRCAGPGCVRYLSDTGFALLETGCVSSKNVANIMIKNSIDVTVGGLAYWMFGYENCFQICTTIMKCSYTAMACRMASRRRPFSAWVRSL
jgi:hypothetical protein